jgi:hypothetical protein
VPACAKCRKEIPRRTAVLKRMATGKYADGGDFVRDVNLCPNCAQEQEEAEKARKKQKVLVLVGAVVAAIGGVLYFLVFRP